MHKLFIPYWFVVNQEKPFLGFVLAIMSPALLLGAFFLWEVSPIVLYSLIIYVVAYHIKVKRYDTPPKHCVGWVFHERWFDDPMLDIPIIGLSKSPPPLGERKSRTFYYGYD